MAWTFQNDLLCLQRNLGIIKNGRCFLNIDELYAAYVCPAGMVKISINASDECQEEGFICPQVGT